MSKKYYPHFDREAVDVPEVDDAEAKVASPRWMQGQRTPSCGVQNRTAKRRHFPFLVSGDERGSFAACVFVRKRACKLRKPGVNSCD